MKEFAPRLASLLGLACFAAPTLADSTNFHLGEEGALGQSCYDEGDWDCAFENILSIYEAEMDRGGVCDFNDQGCGMTVMLTYDLAVKAYRDVELSGKREVAERYLSFLSNVKVSQERITLFNGLLLGTGALRMDACSRLADGACERDAARFILNILGEEPSSIDKVIDAASMAEPFPLDLKAQITTAQSLLGEVVQ